MPATVDFVAAASKPLAIVRLPEAGKPDPMPAMQFGGLCAPNALFIDLTGWCVYASPQLAQLLRTTQQGLFGTGWLRFLDGRDMTRDEWRDRHHKALSFMLSHALRLRPDNPERGFHTRFTRHVNIHGEHVGYIGFVEDVTVTFFRAAQARTAVAVAESTEQIV